MHHAFRPRLHDVDALVTEHTSTKNEDRDAELGQEVHAFRLDS